MRRWKVEKALLHEQLLRLRCALERLDCPLTGKDRCLQEFLAAVLLVNKLLLKVICCNCREQEGCRGRQLSFRVFRVEDESLALRTASDLPCIVCAIKRTQSPPSILRERYIPTAAMSEGFALKKR